MSQEGTEEKRSFSANFLPGGIPPPEQPEGKVFDRRTWEEKRQTVLECIKDKKIVYLHGTNRTGKSELLKSIKALQEELQAQVAIVDWQAIAFAVNTEDPDLKNLRYSAVADFFTYDHEEEINSWDRIFEIILQTMKEAKNKEKTLVICADEAQMFTPGIENGRSGEKNKKGLLEFHQRLIEFCRQHKIPFIDSVVDLPGHEKVFAEIHKQDIEVDMNPCSRKI